MEQVKHRTARNLVHRLTAATTPSDLSTALSEIRLLSKVDPSIRSPLADSGLVPLLTHLLLLHSNNNSSSNASSDTTTTDTSPASIQENALATLLNLSISVPSSLMSSPSLLPALSSALLSPSPPVLAQHAAATLYSLLSVESYRPIIGSKHALVLTPLISLLGSPFSPVRTIKDSLKALFALALYPLNCPPLVDLGLMPPLFSIVVNFEGSTGIVEDATAVVAQVAGCYESVDGFRKVGGVRILVGLVRLGEGRVKENAVKGLLNLAMSGGERAVGDIREVEMAEEAVREVAEGGGGSERARKKAQELLRVLEIGRGMRWNVVNGHSGCGGINDDREINRLTIRSCSSAASSSFDSSTSL